MQSTAEDMDRQVAVLKRPSRPLTVFLDESLLDGLRALAAGNERSLSGEVRYVLRRYVEYPEGIQ